MKKPAPAQILAEQGYIILAADVSYPLGSMIPLADCGPDYERIPGPMVVIGEATIDEWRARWNRWFRRWRVADNPDYVITTQGPRGAIHQSS